MKNFSKSFLVVVFVCILFVAGEKNVALAETCSGKYGSDYQCVKTSAIVSGKATQCKSDVTCSPNGTQCCPFSAVVSFGGTTTGGAGQPVCAAGYSCKNSVGVSDADMNQCLPSPCKTETYINGRCCPLNPAPTTPAVGSSGAITDTRIPGTTTEGSDIIKCGRPGQEMCTICDMIAGMNNIIQYLMKISIGIALLAMAIGGVMYIISAGDSKLVESGKSTMKNAAIGFVIIFAAYIIIDTTINYIGIAPGMGIKVTSWGQFICAPGIH